MSRRLAAVFAVLSLAGGAGAATGSPAVADGIAAHAACTRATIGGQSKCIARGQFCAKAKDRDYRKYGLSCSKQDRNGRWHLQ